MLFVPLLTQMSNNVGIRLGSPHESFNGVAVKIRHITSFFFAVPRVSELLSYLIEDLVYLEYLVTGKRVYGQEKP